MNPKAAEWIEKAEADFRSLERECRARVGPNYDGACFHAQQCVEKYLKAILLENNREVPKIHNLPGILNQIVEFEPVWELLRKDLAFLSAFSVAYQYPGDSADRQQALDARRKCRWIRREIRDALGLEK